MKVVYLQCIVRLELLVVGGPLIGVPNVIASTSTSTQPFFKQLEVYVDKLEGDLTTSRRQEDLVERDRSVVSCVGVPSS